MVNENLETPVVETPVVEAPVVEAPVAPVELPEWSYSYQVTDDHDRPIGGTQVVKYRAATQLPDEICATFVKPHREVTKALREVTKKQRLGIVEQDEIPAEAVRFDAPVEFKPRDLTADERVKISRDLLDPERFEQANATLFEANVGVKPEVFRQTMTNLQVNNLRLLAKTESEAFVASNPDYHKCKDNLDTITNWLLRYDLAPTRENFQLAYDKLRAAGLLLEAPKVREDAPPVPTPVTPAPASPVTVEQTLANTQPAQVEPSRITTEEPAQEKRPVIAIPTGLTRNQGSDHGAVRVIGDEIIYELALRDGTGKLTGEKKVLKGIAAINTMPSDEFKRRVNSDKSFQQKAEKILSEASKPRR
jgi:hypothetical protein